MKDLNYTVRQKLYLVYVTFSVLTVVYAGHIALDFFLTKLAGV